MPPASAPLPPLELATRVGRGPSDDPYEAYEREGADVRARVEGLLPAHWSWDGKRVLDFGCGSARVLRHFLDEAARAEFWGCDIDARSVAWVQANLCPPLHCFRNELAPRLALGAGTFDLVYATSVFTHIGDGWSAWLLELHRILRPGGLLVTTFLGEGMWEALVGEPYRDDEVGMTVRHHWTGPDMWVFHSEWWLREHWGRAFEIDAVVRPPRDTGGRPQVAHSLLAARKRPVAPDVAELERVAAGDPREIAALQTNVRLLRAELEAAIADQPEPPDLQAALRLAVLATPAARPARALSRRLRRRR